MNRLCFISRNYRGTSSAGNKAKTDYEQILRDLGATNLGLETTFSTSQVVSFVRNLMGIIHMSSKVQKGDIIVLQYDLPHCSSSWGENHCTHPRFRLHAQEEAY